ncbi:MAG: hypothetical protein HOV68_27125, partial [Streptomycetaceae bacterium]|nr:hypothetical protein [Streptomycetaceae bacterium]
ADRLVELALGAPAGHVPDMGGPHVYEASDLARSWLRAAGKKRWVLPTRIPGKAGAGFRSGALTTPRNAVGVKSWEEYLTAKVAH